MSVVSSSNEEGGLAHIRAVMEEARIFDRRTSSEVLVMDSGEYYVKWLTGTEGDDAWDCIIHDLEEDVIQPHGSALDISVTGSRQYCVRLRKGIVGDHVWWAITRRSGDERQCK